MKPNLVLTTVFVVSFAIVSDATARGPGSGGVPFGSGPPAGGFGYQGPQFVNQGPNFGDSRASTYGSSANRAYENTSPALDTGTLSPAPDKPGNQSEPDLSD